MSFRANVRKILHSFGYDISAYAKDSCGRNAFLDMRRFVSDDSFTTVFDVGANEGQFLETLRLHFPRCKVYSFEPGPKTYEILRAKSARMDNVTTWNCGLGADRGSAMLLENSQSVMSSILELGEKGWGKIERQTEISIRTVDEFCEEQGIERVDILKTDTQGFDLEVL